jgi:serine phosphatase RsbU (regulator of sigma subunit)
MIWHMYPQQGWRRLATKPDRPVSQDGDRLQVLLIEDDEADAFLVSELLSEVEAPIDLSVAPTMTEAKNLLDGVDCVLLDLGLPDATGLDGLQTLLQNATGVAVCVLTGLADEHLGAAAVAVGAQDYLVKGRVDGTLLFRAVRYAVERKRADENAQRLREAELRQAESARLERGLLPQPLMDTQAVGLTPLYRPGRRRALLGGDFYDAIQTAPDRLSLLIGDVCGHGVEEAALGVELRVSWRALTLAKVPEDAVLAAVEQVLVTERHRDEIFATVATAVVDLADRTVSVRSCGHPPPLLINGRQARPISGKPAIVLGVVPGARYPATVSPLPPGDDWAVLVYTDGLIEGRAGNDRLGVEGLCALVAGYPSDTPLDTLPAWLISQAEERNGEPLADDVAMLLLAKECGA